MKVRFALDTSVLSETSKKKPDLEVILWLARVRRALIPVGVITEFEQGIHMRAAYDFNGALALSQWLDGLLAAGIKVAETDSNVARRYGEMRACKALRYLDVPSPLAQKVGGQDLHIAAAAIEHGLCIATLNAKDFIAIHRRFRLPGLYDPKFDHWYVYPGGKQVCARVKTDPDTLHPDHPSTSSFKGATP